MVVVEILPDFIAFAALESSLDVMLTVFLLVDPLVMSLAIGGDVVGWECVTDQVEECGECLVLVPGRSDGSGVVSPWGLGEYLEVLLVLGFEFFQHLAVFGVELCNEQLVCFLLGFVVSSVFCIFECLLPVVPGVILDGPWGPYGVTSCPFLGDFMEWGQLDA